MTCTKKYVQYSLETNRVLWVHALCSAGHTRQIPLPIHTLVRDKVHDPSSVRFPVTLQLRTTYQDMHYEVSTCLTKGDIRLVKHNTYLIKNSSPVDWPVKEEKEDAHEERAVLQLPTQS